VPPAPGFQLIGRHRQFQGGAGAMTGRKAGRCLWTPAAQPAAVIPKLSVPADTLEDGGRRHDSSAGFSHISAARERGVPR